MNYRNALLVLTIGICFAPASRGAEFSIEQEPSGDVAIRIDGELFTRYVTTDQVTNKCYFWPIVGPGGIKMTRAFPMEDVEGEKQDHPHHRSVCFGLQDAGGFNTWHEALTFTKNGKVDPKRLASMGRQVHTKVVEAEAFGNSATLVVEGNNVDPDGNVYMKQTRNVNFHVAENGSRIMDIEIVLTGMKDSITILGKKDSGLTVRVAHSMCVDAGQGGGIVNSKGDIDGNAWGKRCEWVDFYGPAEGKTMGVAMLNHPDSFRHPTPWHARKYGLFTANPFALKEVGGEEERGDFDLKKGESITLKHRIIFHAGDARTASIADAWTEYAGGGGTTADTPELQPIFNGKDLGGWKQPENNIWWIAEDGMLRVKSGPNRKGSNLFTEKEYADFVMEFDFRFGEGTVDSGVFMRNGKDQIQIGISGSLKRDMTGSPYIPGKGYPVEADGVKELLQLEDWNAMKIQAVGKTYTVWLNGKQVMTYESDSAIDKGPIGIQLHGNRDMSIDYRNIKAADLN